MQIQYIGGERERERERERESLCDPQTKANKISCHFLQFLSIHDPFI